MPIHNNGGDVVVQWLTSSHSRKVLGLILVIAFVPLVWSFHEIVVVCLFLCSAKTVLPSPHDSCDRFQRPL